MSDRTTKGLLSDGFGNVWEQCEYEPCGLEIVRPGKVQCERCQYASEQLPAATRDACGWPTCECNEQTACPGMESLCAEVKPCEVCGKLKPLDCSCP